MPPFEVEKLREEIESGETAHAMAPFICLPATPRDSSVFGFIHIET
jgi:hypothetical protein